MAVAVGAWFGRKVMLRSAVATLPAASVAVSVKVFNPLTSAGAQLKAPPLPTVEGAPLQDAETMPEPLSVAFPLSVTGDVATVASAAGEVMAIRGVVLSMLRVSDALAALPARSCAAPLIACPAPSDETVTGGGQAPIVDRLSLQMKLTTTSVRFQAAALGGGAATAAMVGGVLSMLSAIDVCELFPARSTTVPLTI